MTDRKLLSNYLNKGSEEALAELVKQHTAMVYGTCLRGLGGNTALAEDACQAVFVILAEKAQSLRHRQALAAWLFQTANFVVANMKREEAARKRREAKAAPREEKEGDMAAADWEDARPLLNEAIGALRAKPREAVILHFLEGRTQKEVAAAVGCSEAAAKKRIAYGVKKLRGFFRKRGALLSVAALLAGLQAEVALAASPALIASCTAVALKGMSGSAAAAGSAALSSTTVSLAKGGLKMMFWAKMKAAAAVVCVVAVAGGGTGVTVKAVAGNPAKESRPRQVTESGGEPSRDKPIAKGKENKKQEPTQAGGKIVGGLQLVLEADKTECPPGGPILFTVRLVNRRMESEEPIKYFHYPHVCGPFLQVIGPDGKKIRNNSRQVKKHRSSPGPRHVKKLAPGQEWKSRMTVARTISHEKRDAGRVYGWDIRRPGNYTVAATYYLSDHVRSLNQKLNLGVWDEGELVSNKVVFTVLPVGGEIVGGLQLVLEADKTECPPGGPVRFIMRLVNRRTESEQPIKYLQYPRFCGPYLQVIGPDGKKIRTIRDPRVPPASWPAPGPGSVKKLAPGEEWKIERKVAWTKLEPPWERKNIFGKVQERIPGCGWDIRKPGRYTVVATYGPRDARRLNEKHNLGIWDGEFTSNEVVLNVLPAAGKSVNGLQISLTVKPTAWKLGQEIEFTCTARNVSPKPIRIAWGLMDYSKALELIGPDGKPVESGGGRDITLRLGADAFPVIQPGASKQLTLTGRLSKKRMLIVTELQGGIWHWPNMAGQALDKGSYVVRAVIDTRGRGELYKRYEKQYGPLWAGTVKSNPVKLTIMGEGKTAGEKLLLDARYQCRKQLKMIGLGVMMHSFKTNYGKMPKNLAALYANGKGNVGGQRDFVCPESGKGYLFVAGLPLHAMPNAVIAFDAKGSHANGRNVLFKNVLVKFLSEEQFQKELARTLVLAQRKGITLTVQEPWLPAGIAKPEAADVF